MPEELDTNHLEALLEKFKGKPNLASAREAIESILEMLSNGVEEVEWRIASATLIELERSFCVFAHYREQPKVTVFGSARAAADSEAYRAAFNFARRMVESGYMVITGAGGGIMEAANKGAGVDKSFGLNIDLPLEQEPNAVIAGSDKLINFKYFFTRKLTFIKESDALALFPGGLGTMDEAFELLTLIQCGRTPVRPVVMIDVPELNYWTKWLRFMQSSQLKNGFIDKDNLYLWTITYDVEEACRIITDFYRNFHSLCYLGDRIVMRIKRELSVRELAVLNRTFFEMVPRGEIEQSGPLAEEAEAAGGDLKTTECPELPRLVFEFDRRSFGRLRRMIDRINQFA